MKTYAVKFLIKAVVELEVKAETPEDAIEKAKAKMNKTATFGNHLSYVDRQETVIGYDDQDAWDEVNS